MTVNVRVVAASLLVVATTGVSSAQSTWLPPQVAEGLAQQFVDRVTTVGLGPAKDPKGLQGGARQLVDAVRRRIDVLGERGMLDQAPAFPQITLPPVGDRFLAAMGRYQLCNVVLTDQFENGATVERRSTAALGLTAVTMAVVRFRQPFVAAGGSPDRIEKYLTGADWEPVFERIQSRSEFKAHVERQCEPVVTDLLSLMKW